MRFSSDFIKGGLVSVKNEINVDTIKKEMEDISSVAELLHFYTPKSSYNEDGAYFSYGNHPVGVGYIRPDNGLLRLICLKNDEPYYLFKQVTVKTKEITEQFEVKTMSLNDMTSLFENIYNAYETTTNKDTNGPLEKAPRSIAWMNIIFKRDHNATFKINKEQKTYSFDIKRTPSDLIEEMIKKVDMKRFMQMLAIGASRDGYKKFPSKEHAEKILKNWATAKAPFYKLFGNNFYIEREVESLIDEKEMAMLVEALKMKMPKYSFAISQTNMDEWISNEINSSSRLDNWKFNNVNQGMKLTKAFATVFGDSALDMAISEVTQNRMVKGKIRVSIDPYDFLTMSVNKHKWESCHRITTGEWGTGPWSYMCDDVSLIAYKCNGLDYNYEFFGFNFTGNSKSWRANVLFDPRTSGFAIGRQYPQRSEDIETTVKDMLCDVIKEGMGVKNFSYIIDEFNDVIDDKNSMHYNDFIRTSERKYLVYPSDTSTSPSFTVGSVVVCPYCGKGVTSAGSSCAHSSCLS